MFTKRKSFKQVKINKSVYVKVLAIPVIASGFFVHIFLTGYGNIAFMSNGLTYMDLASSADHIFYSKIVNYQK